MVKALSPLPRGSLPALEGATLSEPLRLPGLARALTAISSGGRAAFYGGEFGAGLIELGRGLFAAADLDRSQADWVNPLSGAAMGVDLHTMPPNSQGYLTIAAAQLVDLIDLQDGDPLRLFTDEERPVGRYTGARLLFDEAGAWFTSQWRRLRDAIRAATPAA